MGPWGGGIVRGGTVGRWDCGIVRGGVVGLWDRERWGSGTVER